MVGAAGPAMAEPILRRTEVHQLVLEVEADRRAPVILVQRIPPVGDDRPAEAERLLRQEGRTAGGEAAIDLRDRPRRADAVGAGHLCGVNGAVVPEERRAVEDRRVAPDAPEQRVGGELLGAAGRRQSPVRREFQRGDARLVLLGQADPELDAERPRHLLGEEPADAPPVDPADQFAAEPAIGQRVVAERRARIGVRRLGGEDCRHAPVVDQVGGSDRHVDPGEPCGVRDDVPDEDLRLAELGPVAAHGIVEAELATVDQHEDAERHQALGAGIDELERILAPRPAARPVGDAAPEIDHRLAVAEGREGRPELAALGEVPFKGFPDRFVARGDISFRHASLFDVWLCPAAPAPDGV